MGRSSLHRYSRSLCALQLITIVVQLQVAILLLLLNGQQQYYSCLALNAPEEEEEGLKSDKLCSQCSKCEEAAKNCPASEAFPHMTAFDNTLIAGALQSDYIPAVDRGVYSVPNIKGGTSSQFNAYFGWQSASGSASGYHRFSNYMDKCSGGQSYLTVDKHGKVNLRSLKSLESLAQADWKSINPPKKFNHQGFHFWLSHSTGKCLTVFPSPRKTKTNKTSVAVADCKFDGSNPFQLFAFRFHYHKAFCCCGVHSK